MASTRKSGKNTTETGLLSELQPFLEALDGDALKPAPGPLVATALAGKALVEHARVPSRATLLAKLDPALFDPGTVDRLDKASALLLEFAVAAEQADAQATHSKVRPEIVALANAVKARLQRVLEYQLTDDASARELDAIRPGTSYKDLATDLLRLAALADSHPTEIAGDRHFVAADPAEARRLSAAIVSDLGTALAALETVADDTRNRLVTLLTVDYTELLLALNYVGRNEPKSEQEKRQALRTIVNGRKAPKKAATAETPED